MQLKLIAVSQKRLQSIKDLLGLPIYDSENNISYKLKYSLNVHNRMISNTIILVKLQWKNVFIGLLPYETFFIISKNYGLVSDVILHSNFDQLICLVDPFSA